MEFSQVKQNVEVSALSTQSPLPLPPPNSRTTPRHQPPPTTSSATAPAHHQCTSTCFHHFPPNTTLSLATPYQPPSPAATAPSAFTLQAAPSPTDAAAAPALCVVPPHECIFSCGHCPTITTLSLATPHQPPPSAAIVPPATATPHHEPSFIVLALPADTPYHEPSSSSVIAPTLAVSTPQPAPSSTTATSTLCFPMPKYKSSLYMLVHKLNISSFPKFHTVCEGPAHAPRFQSRVWVDNTWFTSQTTFSKRKDAEEDVSKVAFEALNARLQDQQEASKVKNDGRSLILEKSRLCKTILYEYTVKMKIRMPTYQTSRQEGLLDRYVSSVVIDGINYTGDTNKNKKDAEQSAACAAILTILGGSTSGTLSEILESKSIDFAASRQDTSQSVEAGTAPVSVISNAGHTSVPRNRRDKEVVGPQVAYGSETNSEILAPSDHMPSSAGELQKLEHESSIGASMPQNMSLQSGQEQSIGDGSTSRKRQRTVGLQVAYESATNVELHPQVEPEDEPSL